MTLRRHPWLQAHGSPFFDFAEAVARQQEGFTAREQSHPAHCPPRTIVVRPEGQTQKPTGIDDNHTSGSIATISSVRCLRMFDRMMRLAINFGISTTARTNSFGVPCVSWLRHSSQRMLQLMSEP